MKKIREMLTAHEIQMMCVKSEAEKENLQKNHETEISELIQKLLNEAKNEAKNESKKIFSCNIL